MSIELSLIPRSGYRALARLREAALRAESGDLDGASTLWDQVAADTSADSLLRDRRAAQQSWEITQVNEMLTRMERHPCPFACTTNAPELLDAAAARRFLFKVRFLPMTANQIAQAHRRAFGAEAPAFVVKLDGLTPADFAIVARKARLASAEWPWPAADWKRGWIGACNIATAHPGIGAWPIIWFASATPCLLS